jgi:amino acid transporter
MRLVLQRRAGAVKKPRTKHQTDGRPSYDRRLAGAAEAAQNGAVPPDAGVETDASVTRGEREGLKREFSLWSIFALAFAFISPIVALYGIFAFAFTSAGPAAWWGFWIVLAGQLLVAFVFAELASRWPFEGSLYQWSRRLIHETYGWFTGWAYMWTLMITMTAVSYGAAGFVPVVLDIDPFEPGTQLLVALGFVAFGTLMNASGRTALKVFMAASIGAEVIGSLGIGTVLLFFHNEHGLGTLFESAGAVGSGGGGYLWAGFLAAVAFIGWAYVGFDTAASVSEECTDPRRDVPKAVILSLVTVAIVVSYASLALILAIPDYGAVLSGKVVDPVADTITFQLGSGITRPLFGLFIVGFTASLIAIQTNCSRIMWAFARADVLPASRYLRKLSPGARLPHGTILTTCAIAAILLVSTQSEDLYLTLVSMATGGFYISFALPVLGALWVRLKGRWTPSAFSLGRWGLVVAVAASVWTVFEYLNIAWPRAVDVPWYQDWAVFVMTGIVLVLGVAVYLWVRPNVLSAENRLEDDETAVHWSEPAPAEPQPQPPSPA